MSASEALDVIGRGFEMWLNEGRDYSSRLSVVINCSDEQTLSIKAYHRITITMMAVGIKDSLSYTIPLLAYSENYNHGVTSEEDAMSHSVSSFITRLLELVGKGKFN